MGISTCTGMLLMSRHNHLKTEGEPRRPYRPRIVRIDAAYCYDRTDLGSCADTAGSQRRRPGNEIQAPVAIVILYGLLSSTLLNIYVVPAL